MYSSQDLAVLVAIADTGSLRGAAAALSKTQPAITQAVQRLEEAVGFSLLDRSSYRARFTERGEIFVQRARVTVSQLNSLQTTAALLARGIEPRLRIAVHGTIPDAAWLHLVKEIPQRFPSTIIDIELSESGLTMQRLLDGHAEFAVLLQSYPDRYGTTVESLALGEVELVNVVRADRTLLVSEGSSEVPQVLATDFDATMAHYASTQTEHAWHVSNHRMKAAVIAAGLGWGTLPKSMIERELADGTFVLLSHLGTRERGSRTFSLYRKRERPLGPVAAHIWDVARGQDKNEASA